MLGLLSSLRAPALASAVRWCQLTASAGGGGLQLQLYLQMQRRFAHLTAYSESLNACSDCPVFRVLSDASFSARMRASFLPARCSGSQQAFMWFVLLHMRCHGSQDWARPVLSRQNLCIAATVRGSCQRARTL